jgi:TPR repeat protein
MPGLPALKSYQRSLSNRRKPRALFERALFESALPLAEGGDAVAQYRVGVIYFDGLGGVPRDRKAGLEWMQRAAAGGHA